MECRSKVADHIYIFEFKLDKDAQQAVAQIVDKGYAQKYGASGKAITLVDVNFDSQAGQVRAWQVVAKSSSA